jgi:hypothetical protein
MTKPFTFEAVAKALPKKKQVAAWTDGLSLSSEESLEDRRQGFVPAFRLKVGKKYRITIEELPPEGT